MLLNLFEAARWAPSSRNEQPWRFIVAVKEEQETFAKILSCLNERNRLWAQHASLLFITLAKQSFTDGRLNTHAAHDAGLAVGNISLQATAQGLFLHQMGGLDREKVKSLFEVPEEFEVISITAAGYAGSSESLPEELRAHELQPRKRKPLDELVFSGKFGEKLKQ